MERPKVDVLSALIEISHIIPGYTIEDLLNHSIDWVNEVYRRAVRVQREELKLLALLSRAKNKVLLDFNKHVDIEGDIEHTQVASKRALMNLQKKARKKKVKTNVTVIK